jgi:hypothetical protein
MNLYERILGSMNLCYISMYITAKRLASLIYMNECIAGLISRSDDEMTDDELLVLPTSERRKRLKRVPDWDKYAEIRIIPTNLSSSLV